MKRTLKVTASSLKQAGKGFIKAWHLAESGENIAQKDMLTFESLPDLLKTLTPKRLELLKMLRSKGATSIRTLSKLLGRDYHNVHTDIRTLENCGLIRKKEDKPYVPWSTLVVSLSLTSEQDTFPKKLVRSSPKRPIEKHHKKAS